MTDQETYETFKKRLNVQANFALWSVTRTEMLSLMHIIDKQREVILSYEAEETQRDLRRGIMTEMLKCAAVVLFFAVMTVLNHG